jgi:predicted solute-binding protein
MDLMRLERAFAIGCPSEWSYLPLRRELKRLSNKTDYSVLDQGSMISLLEEGKVSLAPCCVTHLMRNPQLELALSLGLAARSGANLLFWGCSSIQATSITGDLLSRVQELKELFAYFLNQQGRDLNLAAKLILSATREFKGSVAPVVKTSSVPSSAAWLSRILMRLLYGEAAFEDSESVSSNLGLGFEGPAMRLDILAGNEALQRRSLYSYSIDLIDLWEQITGLPFVFNVWLRYQESFDVSLKAHIIKSAELAQAAMKVQPVGYLPEIAPTNQADQKIDLPQLWKTINYRLGAPEMRSMVLFLNMVRHMSKRSFEDDHFAVKMIRLQQKEHELSYL